MLLPMMAEVEAHEQHLLLSYCYAPDTLNGWRISDYLPHPSLCSGSS